VVGPLPGTGRTLWTASRTELEEHIEVLVNDAVLGDGSHSITRLDGGERIYLLGQFMEGEPPAALRPEAAFPKGET